MFDASGRAVITRHRTRRIFVRRIDLAAEPSGSRSAFPGLEQSQSRTVCRATAPVAVFPRWQARRLPYNQTKCENTFQPYSRAQLCCP